MAAKAKVISGTALDAGEEATFSETVPTARDTGSGRVATNMRACYIMEAVAAAPNGLTPKEVADSLDLPKQTVYRVCHSLVDERFLFRASDGRTLLPGDRLQALVSNVSQSSRNHILRHQILERVARAVGETVNFVMPQESGMSYVDRVETDWPFRVELPIGSSVPFHCTASGKAWLGSLPHAERARMIGALQLDRYTERTICNPNELLAAVEKVTLLGYSTDNEEFMDGMVAVAVPVTDDQGRYYASLAFHAPTVRLDIDQAIIRRDILLEAARDLSKALFVSD
ncbi:MAG: IclR family transcriptional regulator [Ahrensia sp.]|nr:IclR family transcriptional regulator [Ahrensia sp.]